jgi:tetratricopeptide (TPR) repeat protein
MVREERSPEAREYLIAFLREYGAAKEADVVWDRLDLVRLHQGQRLEAAADYPAALREYAAVREGGAHFDDAQRGIRRIWLISQQQRHQDQTIAQLLEEAEEHFQAKRYLTPVNRNAFPLYQTVLSMDPGNPHALRRIEQMEAFYRNAGNSYFDRGAWGRALTYFERCRVIVPDDPDIQRKMKIARDKLAVASTAGRRASSRQDAADAQQEKVKRLLEESGAESSRVMKYLFEESAGEKEADSPW